MAPPPGNGGLRPHDLTLDTPRAVQSMDISSFGVDYIRSAASATASASRRNSMGSYISQDFDGTPSGVNTPNPLLSRNAALSRAQSLVGELPDFNQTNHGHSHGHHVHGHLGDAYENLSRAISHNSNVVEDGTHEMAERTSSYRHRRLTPNPTDGKRPFEDSRQIEEEVKHPVGPRQSQGVPPELKNLTNELVFVFVCSTGQYLFAFLLGDVNVNQQSFRNALDLQQGQTPWLVGSFLTALGLSVILSGSLTDLLPPKSLIVGSFVWLTIWNIVGAFTLHPSLAILFFIVRAMQGLAVGVLVSGSMSILGRVYNPGQRKTRVFSAMAAGSPFGFFLGALQGGALSYHLEWIFGSNAILCGLCAVAASISIPSLRPAVDHHVVDAPGINSFDWKGALAAIAGCICLLFGLTQGSGAHWAPYTYSLIIVGILFLCLFFWIETKVRRPLIPARLWKTPGFGPLMIAYFLGFGGFVGAFQFYAVQFWLTQQKASALRVAMYLLPNAVFGMFATWIVSRLMHRISGHWIFLFSEVAFALGPAFFLGQTPSTNYFALGLPGIGLSTFGPDLSFAAASIYITSSVARSYQGSAGSLLVTVQNLSSAIMTSVADSIATKVDTQPNGSVGLEGLKTAWWLALASAVLGSVITAIWVRIPKEEEKDHVA